MKGSFEKVCGTCEYCKLNGAQSFCAHPEGTKESVFLWGFCLTSCPGWKTEVKERKSERILSNVMAVADSLGEPNQTPKQFMNKLDDMRGLLDHFDKVKKEEKD